MAKSNNYVRARNNPNDEFYTGFDEIHKELYYYTTDRDDMNTRNQFKDKIVFCNCDDPEWSNFWKYFVLNFHSIGLKKLISTHFNKNGEASYSLTYCGKKDDSNKPIFDRKNLISNGDFASHECIEILKDSDIVVTNPPFSLYEEYINLLISNNKSFIIIGKIDMLNYKYMFHLVKNNKCWMGATSGGMAFRVPSDAKVENNIKIDDDGIKRAHFGNICWFTNMDHYRKHELIELNDTYYGNENKYPKYDNYDAIEVNEIDNIPGDYWGVMGVSTSFLQHYNPDQFEIIASSQTGCHPDNMLLKKYNDYYGFKQNGESNKRKGSTCSHNPMLEGDDGKHVYYMNANGHKVRSLCPRIFIKRKK